MRAREKMQNKKEKKHRITTFGRKGRCWIGQHQIQWISPFRQTIKTREGGTETGMENILVFIRVDDIENYMMCIPFWC